MNLNKNNGTAMMLVLIMIGLCLVIVGGIFTGISTMRKMIKSDELKSSQLQAIFNLRNTLSLPNVCAASYSGQDLSTSIAFPNDRTRLSPMRGLNVPVNGTLVNLDSAAPREIASGITFVNMQYLQLSTVASIVQVAGFPYNAYDGKAIISLQKTSSDLFFKDFKDVEVPLQVAVDAAGKIVSCAFQFEEGDTCEKMGGAWRPLAAPGLRCLIKNSCVTAGSYADTGADPAGFTNPLTGGYNCPAGYTARQKGTIEFPYDSGKYSVGNRTYVVYECSNCIDSAGQPLAPSGAPIINSGASFDLSSLDTAIGAWLNVNGGLRGLLP